MKIYTKTGDDGTTALYGGRRLSKNDLRVEAYGQVDELNSWIGLIVEHVTDQKGILFSIQKNLFVVGANLAVSPNTDLPMPILTEASIAQLEIAIDLMNDQLAPLKHFILPGGCRPVSEMHITRTVCRRVERVIIALHQKETVDPLLVKYINRLSDYLFVLARYTGHILQITETVWKPDEK